MTTSLHSSFLHFRHWVWLLLAILCAVGTWTYADRVLIPYQVSDAASQGRPRGNLSDLYPRWIGARELLFHGRDPYSSEVSREIQTGYYGRPLDHSRANDPSDEQGFAYPIYVSFLLAPILKFDFATVQKCFFWILLFLSGVGVLLWIRVLRWDIPRIARLSIVLLSLGSIPLMQGLKLQQISLLVAGLIAIAIALLVADYGFSAGVVLALATVKPQIVCLLLLWLAIWTIADWRARYSWVASFVGTLSILLAASEWYLPHWIPSFWRATREYQRYTRAVSLLDQLVGAPWSWALECLAFVALVAIFWRQRQVAAKTASFAFMVSLALAATVLLLPSSSTYNQVFVIPALLMLIKERRRIWQRSVLDRLLFGVTMCLVVWPWISSVALAGLSFVLSADTVERAWKIPLWTVNQIPVGVAALMLVQGYQSCYQQTFTAQTKAGAS